MRLIDSFSVGYHCGCALFVFVLLVPPTWLSSALASPATVSSELNSRVFRLTKTACHSEAEIVCLCSTAQNLGAFSHSLFLFFLHALFGQL